MRVAGFFFSEGAYNFFRSEVFPLKKESKKFYEKRGETLKEMKSRKNKVCHLSFFGIWKRKFQKIGK